MKTKFIMMIIGLLALAMSSEVLASPCLVSIPKTDLNIEGYPIYLADSLDTILGPLNYRTGSPNDSQFELELNYETVHGRILNSAVVQFRFKNFSSGQVIDLPAGKRTCWNELCSVYDFADSAKKALKSMSKALPACNTSN